MNRITIIDPRKCRKCLHCIAVCPENVFDTGDGGFPIDIRPQLCIHCGHCVAVCPADALIHRGIDMDKMPILEEVRVTPKEFHNLLISKRSIRAFKSKPLESRIIRHLIEMAHQAPSEHNSSEREYTVLTDPEKISFLEREIAEYYQTLMLKLNPLTRKIIGVVKKDIEKQIDRISPDLLSLRSRVSAGLSPVFRNAPCIIFIHAPRWNIFGRDNCIHASDYLSQYAHAAGLGSCIIGYAMASEKIIRQHVRIPQEHRIYSCIALGYPAIKYYRAVPKGKPCIRWM
ncbi:nitroreductase family protein [Myxococcota bacterium]|nr:nitroreductase family protein [Myxococcota bacterium]MBU1380986.1 nitroreductase family protein [Myxococcota bacterium]MBU1496629.1 nitroreductase family protein [Myxococcota bacterium]